MRSRRERPAGRKPATAAAPIVPARGPSPAAPPAVSERVGRFAPSAGQFEPAALAGTDDEVRGANLIRAVQKDLLDRGYEPGTPDGLPGLVTRAAIMAYEHDQGLPVTGEATADLLSHLQRGPAANVAAHVGTRRSAKAPQAEQLTRSVQQSLSMLGYFAGTIDGRSGEETTRAIREYEMDAGLVPTGRISAPLLVKLARSTATGKAAGR